MTNEQPEKTAVPAPPDVPPPPAEPPGPVAPPKKRLSPRMAGLAGFAVGVGLMGGLWALVASDPGEPDTFTMKGDFALTEKASSDGDGGCEGSYDSGYDDISEGTSVTVYGAAGEVVATGRLGESELIGTSCVFDIAVVDVPKGEKFYKVEVSHRGTLQLSAEEAENGELAASLG
ncbi:hypothetical protein ACIPSE_42640 [Streptomyces sp. NPDC090106]|uniref:hypothetical protein n=1 Tax=Streptomyces sp. NPDC090106 TaxID=3365946 RepID=UPI003811079E